MRIVKSAMAFGLVLLALSFLQFGAGGMGSYVGPNVYTGLWIRTGGDIYLEARADQGGEISIYVFNYDDTLAVINTTSVMNTTPLFELVNVTEYRGRIPIVIPGLYSILITSFANNTSVEIDIEPVTPALPLMIPGLGLVIVGALIRFKKYIDPQLRNT